MYKYNDIKPYFIIAVLGGYILKLIKNKKIIKGYDNNIDSIINCVKYGNFEDLSIDKSSKNVILCDNDKILINPEINQKHFGMYISIIQSGQRLNHIYNDLFYKYGNIKNDSTNRVNTLYNLDYTNAAFFELDIRMYAQKHNLLVFNDNRITLQNIIIDIVKHLKLDDDHLLKLDNGRKFINSIKYGLKLDENYTTLINNFKESCKLLNNIIRDEPN